MSDTPDTKIGFNGLIVESIPKKIHKIINLWIFLQSMFYYGRRWYRKYQEKMQYTVTLMGNDDLYNDAQIWLLNAIPSKKRKGIRVVSKNPYSGMAVPSDTDGLEPVSISTWYDGAVEHTVIIDGHRIRVRNEIKDTNYLGSRVEEYKSFLSERNKLLFVAQSTTGRDAVLRLFDKLARERQTIGRTAHLYISTRWGGMRKMQGLKMRPMSTVVLPSGMAEEIMEDMQIFLASEDEYMKLGIPWHRGYLFHGPPGGGKTSLATALASEFTRDVYSIPLGSLEDDSALINAVSEINNSGILLLEDIDIIHASRDRDDEKGVTMQGLLNVLDGLATPHGLITIMTTNNRDILDEAVIRAGRIDKEFEIGKLHGKDLGRLIYMLTGKEIPVNTVSALPADVVGAAKNHIGNQSDMFNSIVSELFNE